MSNTAGSIPGLLHDLLDKLIFISKVGKDQKINVSTMDIVNSDTYFGKMSRLWNRENKVKTLEFLNNVIQQTIQYIQVYYQTEYISIIINKLSESKIGFQNLLETYKNYPRTVSQLSVFLTNIDLQVEKNKHFLQGHLNRRAKEKQLEESTLNNSIVTNTVTIPVPSTQVMKKL